MILSAAAMLYGFAATAAGEEVFHSISTENGLSHHTVYSLYQDEFGTIWAATPAGLNSFNGVYVTAYRNDMKRQNSLSCNHVTDVTGNGNGMIYILTKHTLETYDLHSCAFHRCIQFSGDNTVTAIHYAGMLYGIMDGHTIVKWNVDCSEYTEIYSTPGDVPIYHIFVSSNGEIWFSTLHSLFRIPKDTGNAEKVTEGIYTQSIMEDSRGNICIGTMNNGIVIWDGSSIRKVRSGDGLISDSVRGICEDTSGNYWAGTAKGLVKMDQDFSVTGTYTAREGEGGLTNSSIYDVISDSQGNIWIATYFGGINYFSPSSGIYDMLRIASDSPEGSDSPIIRCILEDSEGRLWLGTEGDGLAFYDRERQHCEWFRHRKDRNSLSGDNIKSMYYDRKRERLWIGTHLKGLNMLDLKTFRFTEHDIPGQTGMHLPNVVSGIEPYGDDLLISSYNGVYIFSPASGGFSKILDINFIRTMFLDSHGVLWLGTTGEQLFSYDMESRDLKSYRSALRGRNTNETSAVYDIAEDRDGTLWFATFGGGLKRMDRSDGGSIASFTTANSDIPSNDLLAIDTLDAGKIIFTTNLGYTIYDKTDGTFENHTVHNGFPLSFVSENSMYCSESGTISIGGIKGLVSFDRERRQTGRRTYPLYFSRLWINGEEVTPDDGSGILEKSMPYTSEIVLGYRQNTFAIEYFIPDYQDSGKGSLVYSLDDSSDEWHRLLTDKNMLNFYNQPPGTYRLVIRSTPDSFFDVSSTSVTIRIKPPFYKTAVAYIIYVLLAGGILTGILVTYYNRLRMREHLRYERKRIQKEEALNQSKLQFFFSISHELCTPLTITICELELLLMRQKFTDEVRSKLENIYKNELQLRDLITELLEFRKQDMGKMKLNVAEYDICEIADESILLYREYAISREVDIDFIKEEDHISIWCDRKQISKVFNNLLSNALKYTEPGGKVTISVGRDGENIVIKVQDTGCGIDKEDLRNVFSDFYQGKQSYGKMGTGIGLSLVRNIVGLHKGEISVESEPHRGTTFTVRLKTGKGHFSESDMLQITSGQSEGNASPAEAEYREVIPHEGNSDTGVLIAEDNQVLREMLVSIFSRYYRAYSAPDGKVAWEILQKEDISLVVSDILMPNMSGIELCRLIKTNLATCHIPVVLLSVRAEEKSCIAGFNVGADEYLPKPFSISLLLTRCSNLLKNRRLLQEKFIRSPQEQPEILTTNDLDKEFIEKITRYIEDNIDNTELNINTLLKEMPVSRTTLFQKLKMVTGQTPMEFIISIRLKKAALLLRTRHDMSISAISDAVGFSSSKYFSRIFKEAYHITPTEYRNGKLPDDSADSPPAGA